MIQFLSRVLYECVSHEKLEVLSAYMWLHQAVASLRLPQHSSPLSLNQLSLMLAYYRHQPQDGGGATEKRGGALERGLVSREFLLSLQGRVDTLLQAWLRGRNVNLS